MDRRSYIAILVKIALLIPVMALVMFLPAGTWYWPEAYLFVTILLVFFLVNMFYLGRHDPSLLKKRNKMKPEKGWDMVFTIFSTIMFLSLLPLSGLDAVRFGWSSMPLELKAAGFVVLSLSLLGVFLVMKENTYLFRIVKVQKGQKVIDTGPYSIVRHPMYSSFIAMMIALPLALGSYYSLIPSVLMVISIIARTVMEDRILHKELKGYSEYAKKTRYKLFPGLW